MALVWSTGGGWAMTAELGVGLVLVLMIDASWGWGLRCPWPRSAPVLAPPTCPIRIAPRSITIPPHRPLPCFLSKLILTTHLPTSHSPQLQPDRPSPALPHRRDELAIRPPRLGRQRRRRRARPDPAHLVRKQVHGSVSHTTRQACSPGQPCTVPAKLRRLSPSPHSSHPSSGPKRWAALSS